MGTRDDPKEKKKPKEVIEEKKKEEAVEKIMEVPINIELINQKVNQLTMGINHIILNQQKIMEKLGIEIK